MGEPKFTPGPWVIIPAREYDGDDDALIGSYTSPAGIEGADGNPVCVFGTCEGSGALFENEADYHLIAAAPALFEALSRAREFVAMGGWESMVNDIDASLAQALGESR